MFREFYYLIKPGIVRGNTMTAIAGFMLASGRSISIVSLTATAVGIAGVISSACVFNNIIDRDIDKKMKRTKKRALVSGRISVKAAVIYAVVLLLIGVGALLLTTFLAMLIALIGFFAYVAVYGYYKRKTVYGTEIGSISGAVPPVVGYVAVTGRIDVTAILLFVILVIWQMPHFYAIGIFREKEYRAAGIPILPVVSGLTKTKLRIMLYVLLFILVVPLLTIIGTTGIIYMGCMMVLSVVWFAKGYSGFKMADSVSWARGMFGFSLLVLTAFSFLITVNAWLP